MNLYDKLKPEVKEAIKNHEYTAISNDLVYDLKRLETAAWDLMSFRNASTLHDIMNVRAWEMSYITLEKFFIED